MKRYGRFVDRSVVMARMDRKDLRFQAAARRQASLRAAGLASEVWPFASVEIVREVAVNPAPTRCALAVGHFGPHVWIAASLPSALLGDCVAQPPVVDVTLAPAKKDGAL